MTATRLEFTRAGPLVTVQDQGRFGALDFGISASGPIDRRGFAAAASVLHRAGEAGIEFTRAGLAFTVSGATVSAGFAGGRFRLSVNGAPSEWPTSVALSPGDSVDVSPGASGNYGYLRFDAEIGVAPVLGSRATNLIAGLGGFAGRALAAGDVLELVVPGDGEVAAAAQAYSEPATGPVRIVWGIHAGLFDAALRQKFLDSDFRISTRLDRMGVRLDDPNDVFSSSRVLSLVSDAVVPGDIQVLGDGTPIVLLRDHQPTGGYPRIATVIGADLDRFAQMRPGESVRFASVTPRHAREALRTAAA